MLKDGLDLLAVASGLTLLWAPFPPRSDELIGARLFALNSVSSHPRTSRSRFNPPHYASLMMLGNVRRAKQEHVLTGRRDDAGGAGPGGHRCRSGTPLSIPPSLEQSFYIFHFTRRRKTCVGAADPRRSSPGTLSSFIALYNAKMQRRALCPRCCQMLPSLSALVSHPQGP